MCVRGNCAIESLNKATPLEERPTIRLPTLSKLNPDAVGFGRAYPQNDF
jgi:hypothetical protein